MSIVLLFIVAVVVYTWWSNPNDVIIFRKSLTDNPMYNPYLANQYSELADTIALRNTPFPIYNNAIAHIDGFKGLPSEAIKYYSKYHPIALSYDVDTKK